MPPPPGGEHGTLTTRFARLVGNYIDEHDLGVDFVEVGVLVGRDPDSVMAADWGFLSKARMPYPMPKGYLVESPDIVLETRSPYDTRREVALKVERWLLAGVRIVWELDPQERILTVHRAGTAPVYLGESDTLSGEEVLPGLEIPLFRVFK